MYIQSMSLKKNEHNIERTYGDQNNGYPVAIWSMGPFSYIFIMTDEYDYDIRDNFYTYQAQDGGIIIGEKR